MPNTINDALFSLSSPSGATIKSQATFSQFSDIASAWIGDLLTLDASNLYQYNGLYKDSLSVIGNYIDPTLTPIPLDTPWNWIGYLPTQSLKVNDALMSIEASNGDIIKSQLHFAQYLDGVGWIGNLKSMSAPNGYLLKLSNIDTLIYPDPLDLKGDVDSKERNPIVPDYHGLTEISATPKALLPFARWQSIQVNMNLV
ncbi:MAG: hypothetical protein IPN46_14725 [Saprospiraceae bacterium]|nr:hypothetical protein [Saprospiraceae bacterium]